MAPLIANSNTYTSRSTRPSTLSSNSRMPHVFVVPPEEEQQDNPPWCCFDADEQPENSNGFPLKPDVRFLDPPYRSQPSQQHAPALISRRISSHKLRLITPSVKKLEKKQHPEAVKIIENNPSQARQRDSDIIEVVKVKRGRETLVDLEENANVKRSRTLKMRATRALQSIKNVGKGSHRTHVKELWTSSESMPGIFRGVQEQLRSQQDQMEDCVPATSTKKGSLSQNSFRSLSRIFQPVKPSRPESSSAACGTPSVTLAETHNTLPSANPSSFSYFQHNSTNPSFNEVPRTLMNARNRSASSGPSMKKNAKFSVRELHRLFSFYSSSPDVSLSGPTATTGPFSSARGSSVPLTSPSTLTLDYSDVFMKEDIFADADLVDLESADRRPAPRYSQAFSTHHGDGLSTPGRLNDLSVEMRLDSLHFDALSFDAEDFDVSMEGNIPR